MRMGYRGSPSGALFIEVISEVIGGNWQERFLVLGSTISVFTRIVPSVGCSLLGPVIAVKVGLPENNYRVCKQEPVIVLDEPAIGIFFV